MFVQNKVIIIGMSNSPCKKQALTFTVRHIIKDGDMLEEVSENILQYQVSENIHSKAGDLNILQRKSHATQVSQNMNKLVYSVTPPLLYIV